MAPSHEEAYFAKVVMTFMGQISAQSSSRYDKKIAGSPELKDFLFYLLEREPSAMDKLLKLASRKCDDVLRVEKEARIARKRAEPPNENKSTAKRVKVAHPTEEEDALSQGVEESNSAAQGCTDSVPPHDNIVPTCDNEIVIKKESEQEKFDWTNMANDTLIVSDNDESEDASRDTVPDSVQQRLQMARNDARDDTAEPTTSASHHIGVDAPTPRSKSKCSETCLPHASASEKNRESRSESSGEEDLNAEPKENELSEGATTPACGSQLDDTVPLPIKCQIEAGITMKEPVIMAKLKAHCLTLKPSKTRLNFDIHDEIANILDKSCLLEFHQARAGLHQYLENREKMPGAKLVVRTTWNMSDPSDILEKLQTVKTNTADNKIHRAYGQTMLYRSVNTQVDEGRKSTVTGYAFDHSAILEELARKRAGPVSKPEIDQMISSYKYEYYAGKKWEAVMDWFGGSGIVLIFVTAGIGSYYVETKWTEFQRKCMKHIAGLLPSIGRLVEILGPEALEVYCREGCLGSDCVERVRRAKFTQTDRDEEPEDAQPDRDEESEDDTD